MKKIDTSNTKKKSTLGKIIACILLVWAAVIGVFKTIELIRTRRFDKKNVGSPVKQFYSFMNAKNIMPFDGVVDGIVATGLFSALSIDLTDVCLKEDAFISLNGLCSAIEIKVPADIKVKCDGYNKATAVSNKAEEGDDSMKTLYVVSKMTACAVEIKRV